MAKKRSSEAKAALVTGASSGIGEAVALKLGSLGFRVAVNARRERNLEQVARRIEEAGGEAIVLAGDLTRKDAPGRIVGRTVEAFGRLDVLVNNAGLGRYSGTLDATDDDFEEQFRLNVWAPFAFVRAAVPVMERQGGGQIINIGSVVGYVGTTRSVVYTATKWALRGFNESWRDEFFAKKVKVAYLAPGFVITEFGQRKPGVNDEAREWAMMPEDVAHYVAAIATQARNADLKEVVVQVLGRS
jgi:3-oxoacyl-[acyl-carrier protein] reductase